jgi:Hsp20/alpha crystallin family
MCGDRATARTSASTTGFPSTCWWEEWHHSCWWSIAAQAFERSFQLADYVEVRGASLENGLLHVDLVREIPEVMKPQPRMIPISSRKVLEVKPTQVAA